MSGLNPSVLFAASELRATLNVLYEKAGYDFRFYAKPSLSRRMQFALERLKISTLQDLRFWLEQDKKNATVLLQYLTVNTTEMFRNPAYFCSFRRNVVPFLKTFPYPNLWIAGCSTGEEVLSYAIILAEEGILSRANIYATDLNPANLERAKNRVYRLERVQEASRAYPLTGGRFALSEYYQVHGNSVQFCGSLLENVTFADHCLVTDSCFSEFHFISCRHVMIYFDADQQSRVLRLFRDSLVDFGLLGLGRSEDLRSDPKQDDFERWRDVAFYRKKPGSGGN